MKQEEELSPKFFGIYMKQIGTFSKRPCIEGKQVAVYRGISIGRKLRIDIPSSIYSKSEVNEVAAR